MSDLPEISSILLELEYELTACPFELYSSPDTRALAVGFEKIVATDASTGEFLDEFFFNETASSNKRVLYGMSEAEPWGAWSNGKSTVILISIKPHAGKVVLYLHHKVVKPLSVTATITVNGAVFSYSFGDGLVTIPVEHPLIWREPAAAENVTDSSANADVSIIIPSCDRPELVYLSVRAISLLRTSFTYEIIVVENGSSAACFGELDAFGLPIAILRLEHPRSFGTVNNMAAERARGDYVLFLNNDAFIVDGLFEGLIEALQDEKTGAAGPTFLHLDGTVQEVGGSINADATTIAQGGNRPFADVPRMSTVDYISAACLALRRDYFLSLGGFDPVYQPAYCEDVDLALRIRSTGKRTRLVKDVFVRHIGNATSLESRFRESTHNALRRNTATLRSRWGAWLGSRDDSDLPPPILLEADVLKRQASGFPGETLNCVSVAERVSFGAGWHSAVAVASALSELHPTAMVGPEPLSLLELCRCAEMAALTHDRLVTSTTTEIANRDVDVHVLSSREFPCVAPAQGHVRILHCPWPIQPREDEFHRHQRRVGGLLNFDAVVVDSEYARQECIRILEVLGAPCIHIHVIPPPAMAVLPVRAKEKLVVSLGPLVSGPGGGMHERVLGALRLAGTAGFARGWQLIIAGDLAHDDDLGHFERLQAVAGSRDVHLVVNPTPVQVLDLIARAHVCVAATGRQAASSPGAADRCASAAAIRAAMASSCISVVPADGSGADAPEGGSLTFPFATIDALPSSLKQALEHAENGRKETFAVDARPDRTTVDAWLDLVGGLLSTTRCSNEAVKPAFVVLGAHRSGTSAMARVLSLAGAELPNDLMPPMPDNPRGFWEPLDIAGLNDSMLERLGSRWDDVFGYAAAEANTVLAQSEDAGRARLRANFSGRRPIVLKDPRISFLVKLWQAWLCEEGYDPAYVIMIRNPLEVADSLTRRNNVSGSRGLMLWASYMVSCLQATRGQKRVFVRYDDLVDDPYRVTRLVTETLGVNLPSHKASAPAIRGFVDPSLRNHRTLGDTLPAPFARVQALHEALMNHGQETSALDDAVGDVHDWLEELRVLVNAGCFTL